jgi:hypothetical protein
LRETTTVSAVVLVARRHDRHHPERPQQPGFGAVTMESAADAIQYPPEAAIEGT